MAELTKQEVLINDLTSIESRISSLIHKLKDLTQSNADLTQLLEEAKKENSVLNQKILKLQGELENFQKESESNIFNSLNVKEREDLKVKLQGLISKINYHLSPDRQV